MVAIGVGADLSDVTGERGPRRGRGGDVDELVLDGSKGVAGAVVDHTSHFAYSIDGQLSALEGVGESGQVPQRRRRAQVPSHPARIRAMTPAGFVRDGVTEAPVGQITGVQLGEQPEPGRVEQAVHSLERVEQPEAGVVVQTTPLRTGQDPDRVEHRGSVGRHREHRHPEPRRHRLPANTVPGRPSS